ncbi:16S rRNA (cytosine(1402)-N(4))-methyltransferase [hydrothermal vent metagenome]|uniref:16S rRNA (Cytosine(1402)-N(4))-methyltransferase n=1 Tax=hydrothermal vent metagenome TaxID=652676 RepID=A0A3B1BJJ9_9ZZZZ
MAGQSQHRPVLLDEALAALNIEPGGCYVDGTFGRGGHSAAILNSLDEAGKLLALDKDPEAIKAANRLFADDPRVIIRQDSFAEMAQQVAALGWNGQVDGILLDLGVSSPQLDDASRGFSFQKEGPLDMRMNPQQGQSAAEWLARAREQDIAKVLKEYGEERFARRIARAIVQAGKAKPIVTTKQLAEIVAQANPAWEKGKDPATRSFQAIRIYINRELDDLEQVLAQTTEILKPGGRLVVISFHSLEDRRVKRFMRDAARGDEFPPDLPVTQAQLNPSLRLLGKAVRASEVELEQNPRARSAIMRVAERLS